MITHWRIKPWDGGDKVLHNDDGHADNDDGDDDVAEDDDDIDLKDKEDGAKDNIEGGNAGRVVNALVASFNLILIVFIINFYQWLIYYN